MYTFLFVDCMYVTIRKEYESMSYAVYTILGYDTEGEKDILGLWLNESESKHTWMQIFDELKSRGVEDMLFISMDGVSGLLFHYDRGVQYASNAYKKQLKEYRMIQRSGVPYDNAPMESFWSTVKTGCVLGRRFKTRKEAILTIFEYVFGFYNTHRYHTSIGLETPAEHRKKLTAA